MTRNFDPALMSFLPQSVVDAELKARGAQITTVTFAKKSGEVTTRTGMPKVYKRRVGGEKGAIAAAALRDNGNVFFDYTNPEGNAAGNKGFAFNKGRVIAIGDSGKHPA